MPAGQDKNLRSPRIHALLHGHAVVCPLQLMAMSGQQVPLQQWSSFFSITSAASATLLGLLFVVITIAPGLGRKLASKSRIYLTPAVIYLTSVLVMSALLTIPNQTQLSSVICICIMGIFGLIYTGSLTILRSELYEKRSDRYRYAVVPFLAYLILFIGGLSLHRVGQVGLDVVAAGMVMLLNAAIRNSWSIAISILSSQN